MNVRFSVKENSAAEPEAGPQILVFKTNLRSIRDLKRIGPLFDGHRRILSWSVDLGDVDKVLRVIADGLTEPEVIALMAVRGYLCSVLPD